VVEESRLFLREDHDPSCPIGEALEQDDPPLVNAAGGAGCAPFYRPIALLLWRPAAPDGEQG